MNKIWLAFKKNNELCYTSCISTGILLLFSYCWDLKWPSLFIFPLSFLVQFLLVWSGEKKTRLQIGLGVFFLNLIPAFYFLSPKREHAGYFLALGFEVSCLFVAAFCYLIRSSLLLKGTLLILQLGTLIYLSYLNIPFPKAGVWLILLCTLVFITEAIEQKSSTKNARNIFYLFPILLVASSILLFLPVKETPIRWTGLKNAVALLEEKYTAFTDTIQYWFSGNNDFYSLATAGFATDGTLGDNVLLSDKPQLTISGSKTHSPLYLAGTIYDSYDGKNWYRNDANVSNSKEYLQQNQELNSALSNSLYTEEEYSEFLHPCSYTVTYERIRTKTVFYSPYIKSLVFAEQAKIDNRSSQGLMLNRLEGIGFSYRFHCSEINFNDNRVISLLQQKAFFSRL